MTSSWHHRDIILHHRYEQYVEDAYIQYLKERNKPEEVIE